MGSWLWQYLKRLPANHSRPGTGSKAALDQIEREWPIIPRLRGRIASPPAPTLEDAELVEFEREFGFALPPLLVACYRVIGNGGWGPGYGLYGLITGAPNDRGDRALDIYQTFLGESSEDPWWYWPRGLLPIVHWGCAVQSCIDCTQPGHPVVRFEPYSGRSDSEAPSTANDLFAEAATFESWLVAWAGGAQQFTLDLSDANRHPIDPARLREPTA